MAMNDDQAAAPGGVWLFFYGTSNDCRVHSKMYEGIYLSYALTGDKKSWAHFPYLVGAHAAVATCAKEQSPASLLFFSWCGGQAFH